MKKYAIITILIFYFTSVTNAQWQQINTPIFYDTLGWCLEPFYTGAIATNSTFYWCYSVACGEGSSAHSFYKIFKTTDNGLNWNLKVFNNFTHEWPWLLSMDFISEDTGYIVRISYSASMVDRTNNGMNSFQVCYYPSFTDYRDIEMISFNDMYAIDVTKEILHLENDTFKVIYNFPSSLYFEYSKIEVTENHIIYLACKTSSGGPNSNNLILRSTDYGLSWDTSFLTSSIYINEIQFYSDSIGFVVGNDGMIMKTEDAGQTWISKSSGFYNNLKSIDYMNDSTWITVGASGIILMTSDGGEAWNNMVSPTSGSLIKVKFPEKDEIVFVQSVDHIWKANLDTNSSVSLHNYSSDYFNLFPNPARDYFTITILDTKIKNASAEIYNLFGDKVFSLNISDEQEIIDCRILPKGIYLVRVVNQGNYSTQRLVIQ